MTEPLVYI